MIDITRVYNWLKENITRRDVLIVLGLSGLYFLTRLVNLDSFPIFTDEGIYIHWSQVAWKDASFRFISLTDGRQPFQTWATIPFLKLFPDNALFAGRLFGVASGFATMTGLFVTSLYLFNKKTAYTALLLYILTPYFLFYDRMALVDTAVNASTMWLFFFSILLAKTRRLDVALVLGGVAGMAMLTKSSMRLYVAMIALGALWIIYAHVSHKPWQLNSMFRSFVNKKKVLFSELLTFALLYGLTVSIALVIYNVQRLSQYMHIVEQKNTTFVLTLPELLADPFGYFVSNITSIPYYIFAEMAFIVPSLALVGLVIMYRKERLKSVYIALWILIPLVLLSFVARVLFPRYVLSLGGFLLLPAAYLIAQMPWRKYAGIIGIILVAHAYMIYTMLFAPALIPFPQVDRGQYIESWPAGWGIKEIVDFAEEKSKEKPVYLLADGDFGMAGDVLRVHVGNKQGIHVRTYWPLNVEHLLENQTLLEDSYVYVVFPHCKEENYTDPIDDSQRCANFEQTRPLKLVNVYHKPGRTSAIYLFELLPDTE